MKSSLRKLINLALSQKSDAKEKRNHLLSAHLDGLSQAVQDMQEMRSCYDSLLSAAAVTANCAYEFSESLLEMGTCLLDKTGLSADGECGSAIAMLGKVQLELQRLVDSYRSHIILTITNPLESLLSELRKVEEMKLQCDEKREIYEHMMAQYKEKGCLRSGKGETITSHRVQDAREEYDEVARLCIFRLQSLKQGQCPSLLTQAVRHHAAQLNFFSKGLKTLEAVEPHIRLVAERQRIVYQFSGLDKEENEEDEGIDTYETNNDGELSFDYRRNKQGIDNIATSGNPMELDQVESSYPRALKPDDAEINISKNQGKQVFSQQTRQVSYSAPIYAEKRDSAERIKEMQPSARKLHSYALPTPSDTKSSYSKTSNPVPHLASTVPRGNTHDMCHSSPLDTQKHGIGKHLSDDNLSHPTRTKPQTLVTETSPSVQLPPPLAEGLSLPQCKTHNSNDSTNSKRQSFSESSKPWSRRRMLSSSGPITSTELGVSGMLSRLPTPHSSSSPSVSRSTSPIVSSPKISELHELPRPPGSLTSKPSSSGVLGHSAPLISGNRDLSPVNRSPTRVSKLPSPLPLPPLTVTRSFSIPSSSQRAMELHMARLLKSPCIPEKAEDVASPPLTPISLSNMK